MKKREHAMRPHLPSLANEIDLDSYLFFRLCHHCLYLNESNHEVLQCDRCRRPLTVEPFVAELESQGQNPLGKKAAADDEESEGLLTMGRRRDQNQYRDLNGERFPGVGLAGLSVLW